MWNERKKPEPGKLNDQRKLNMTNEVLRDSSCCIISPWIKFEELATSVPALSGNYINGPWE